MESFTAGQIVNIVVSVLTLASSFVGNFQHNHCRSSCCKGWCEVEDDLEMHATHVVKNVQQTPPPAKMEIKKDS